MKDLPEANSWASAYPSHQNIIHHQKYGRALWRSGSTFFGFEEFLCQGGAQIGFIL
jgi:hypothetical protein